MERESFEDEEVGALLNKYFICVKLDREERPDIDKIYMTFVQASTGGGGWPMSVFMTPEQKPFFGGTYFRKPDFMNLCKRVDELWNDKEMRSAPKAMPNAWPRSSPKSPSARPIPTPSCIRAWSLTPSRASKTPTTRVLAASAETRSFPVLRTCPRARSSRPNQGSRRNRHGHPYLQSNGRRRHL